MPRTHRLGNCEVLWVDSGSDPFGCSECFPFLGRSTGAYSIYGHYEQVH